MKNRIQSIRYLNKHKVATDKNIFRLLIPSMLVVILCMACLATTSWAWFTASIFTDAQILTAASYTIDVTITDSKSNVVDNSTTLNANETYTVTLLASGTASEGHCIVNDGSQNLYTSSLTPNNQLTFTLIPDTNAIYTFTAVWGSYSGTPTITHNTTIGTPTNNVPTNDSNSQPAPETNIPEVEDAKEPVTDSIPPEASDTTETPPIQPSETETTAPIEPPKETPPLQEKANLKN